MIPLQLIERSRLLPYSGQVTVSVGEHVDEEQIVARIEYIPGAMRRIDVARPLRIAGQSLRQHLLLQEGELVHIGQTVAAATCFGERHAVTSSWTGYLGLVSRSLGHVYVREPIPVGDRESRTLDVAGQLGISPLLMGDCLRVQVGSAVAPEQVVAMRRVGLQMSSVLSTAYGKVVAIANGQVIIQPLYVRTELPAYLAGRVISLIEGSGVTIRSYARVIPGSYGVGGETGGSLLLASQAGADLTLADVVEDWRGKVVVGGGSASREVLQLAAQVGVHALVLASLPLEALQDFGQSRLVGQTGDEDVPFTLVLTEGFLPQPMARRTWSTLAALEGRYASVSGATQIRAGVIRPEVVVCERHCPDQPTSISLELARGLSVGATVRVMSGGQIGQVGRISQLPAERRLLATGSAVKVAIVDLGDRSVQIPASNLEPWT